jgi:hypothetical protein
MKESQFQPAAIATLRWLSPQEGGRRSVPPGPLFAATARFQDEAKGPLGDVSIVLRYRGATPTFGPQFDADIGFLAPELVLNRLSPGDRFTITEGPRPVAEGIVKKVTCHQRM